MVDSSHAFSGFSVRDLDETRKFYSEVLGLEVGGGDMGVLQLQLANGHTVIMYAKGDDHVPATFTVLNFGVDDVDAAVEQLVRAGVRMEFYDGMPQDSHGIMRDNGPTIAWFTDPSGNVLSVIEN